MVVAEACSVGLPVYLTNKQIFGERLLMLVQEQSKAIL